MLIVVSLGRCYDVVVPVGTWLRRCCDVVKEKRMQETFHDWTSNVTGTGRLKGRRFCKNDLKATASAAELQTFRS